MHLALCKWPSCWNTIESGPICSVRAWMFSIRWRSTNRFPLIESAYPASVNCCAMNLSAHNTVPGVPIAGRATLPVVAYVSCDAPFRPYVSHRSNSIRNLSTSNSIKLCSRSNKTASKHKKSERREKSNYEFVRINLLLLFGQREVGLRWIASLTTNRKCIAALALQSYTYREKTPRATRANTPPVLDK